MKTEIIYEDDAILVVYKPSGLATQSANVGQQDVVSELKNYIAKNSIRKIERKSGSSGNAAPYLGVIHRLDQPVEGLLVFARNRKAAAVLSGQLQKQEAEAGFCKHYYAVLCGLPTEEEGELEDYLCKRDGKAEVVAKPSGEQETEGRIARLCYRILQTLDTQGVALADIQIETGRFHQIRAQMSHGGMPLLGDSKYGRETSKQLSRKLDVRSVALCAYRLEFVHPVTGRRMNFEAKPKGKAFSFFSQF